MQRFNKATAAAVAGAIGVVIGAVFPEIEPEVVAAGTTIVTALLVYLVPNREAA